MYEMNIEILELFEKELINFELILQQIFKYSFFF